MRGTTRRVLRACGATVLALVLPATASAQRVLLEIRPEPGDTIRIRVEQRTEVHGERRRGSAVDATRRVAMSLRLWSRAIVLERLPSATMVLTVTDSVRLTTTDVHARDLAKTTERSLAGRSMRLRLASDGTARLVSEGGERELSAMVSAMPAALPLQPVSVGDSWRREMPVPSADPFAADGGMIRAVFRLDSLSRDRSLAWITVRGELSREPAPAGGGRAGAAMTGKLTGTIVLNRRRGWLDDADFSLNVLTTVAPESGSATSPMQVRTTIVQRMRVEGRRAKP